VRRITCPRENLVEHARRSSSSNEKGTDMSQTERLSQRWSNYRPSKTLWFWTVVGAAALVMIIGFTYGGWTTGGGAAFMAKKAASDARAELAAAVCVSKFTSAENADKNLAALKDTAFWQRNDFIEKGGWAKLAGMDNSVPGSTDLCAHRLAAMESLPKKAEVMPAAAGG
jgi:hypothetical protein